MGEEVYGLDEAGNRIKHLFPDEGKLYDQTKNGKVILNHANTANAMIKFVYIAPLDKTQKKILMLRIGNPLASGKSISHLAIALQLGLRENEVVRIEAEAVKIVSAFMEKVCVLDGVGAFNKETKLENEVKNSLFDGQRSQEQT